MGPIKWAKLVLGKKKWNDFFGSALEESDIDVNDAKAYDEFRKNAHKVWTDSQKEPKSGGFSYQGSSVGTGGFLSKVLASQYRDVGTASLPEFGTIEKTGAAISSLFTAFTNPKKAAKELSHILGEEILLYLEEQTKLYAEVNEKMGMTGDLAEAFRRELMDASPYAIKLGISFNEMAGSVGDLVAQSGKFKLLSTDTIKEMALASKFTDDFKTFAGMGRNFELIGLGIKDMSVLVEKMGMRSLTLGLNARTTTTLVNENLNRINQYGFKNGVEGLNRMVQRSVEFRQNMQNVFDVAEKVWSPEGALEIVSNLQMIGGAYADMNDPIRLMYMATNDVEGLQKAIIETSKSLATYNEEQGRFEVTGANLRRAKEMANLFGISMKELTDTAVAGSERMQASLELLSAGLTMPEEDKEFITNLSRMEGGRMVIEIPQSMREALQMPADQTQLALEDMKGYQKDLILANKQQFEDMTMEDIARQQVTAMENVQRDVSFIRAALRVVVGRTAGDVIEKALHINNENISQISNDFSKWGIKQIGKLDDFAKEAVKQTPDLIEWVKSTGEGVINSIKGVENKVNEGNIQKAEPSISDKKISDVEKNIEKNRTTSVTTPATPSVDRKVIDVNFNPTSASLDEVAKIFWSDPRWQDKFKDSFLYPYSN